VSSLRLAISLVDGEYPFRGETWRLCYSQQRLAFAKTQHRRLGSQSRAHVSMPFDGPPRAHARLPAQSS
jgi:hypothetical protein